jgi:putative oxidoreductase
MDVLFLVGRVAVGLFYLMNALNHFRNVQMLGGYASSKGVPAPQAMVVLTGVLLLVGGLSILFGAYPTVGIAAVVVFLVVVAFWMHNFWTVQDPMQRMGEMVNFNKNLALAGSALMFLAIPQPWPLSLGW